LYLPDAVEKSIQAVDIGEAVVLNQGQM